ncbi:glucose dehydrogenase [FAD, quinone]-like [Macrosteles quadrilineatus]|uniref:glucose dehydrogenase [FAD, quinone]-like n=1 Tax=Macrosteles quadrilineatus TaxID=74068 RepID=UPI0023E2A3EA|nr:glucose dehydrogenase [FAD, quinone]-like [Macrosteles quadrilineatus]
MWFLLRYSWVLIIYTVSSGLYIALINLHYKFDYLTDWFCNDFETINDVYDYIIVGAGSAGCVLAARLSEDPTVNILVIEAGGRPSALLDIPIAAPMLQKTPYDWQFYTEPQQNACLGLNEQRSPWPRGKVVGGTSRLNYLVYLRGHVADYDSWVSPDCQHWSRNEIRSYFKRAERQLGRYANDSVFHSTLGSIPVSDLLHTSGMMDGLLGAGEELGYKIGDLNSGETRFKGGFMATQSTTKDGSRFSADKLLIGRNNVKILPYTQVTKVLLRRNFEAYGVRAVRHGHRLTLRARREVILSAGTVGSPHLLLLSGIGPAKHLQELGITVAVDLPVGENLQDHVATGLDLVVTNQSSPLSWQTVVNPWNPISYLLGQGPMTHPGCEVVGMVNTLGRTDELPDLQFMALPGGLSSDAGVVLKRVMGITDKLWREYFAELVGTPVATLLPTVLHPHSRGCIKLRSKNPNDPPVIDPRYLSDPRDVQVLIRGLQLLVRLTETEAMRKIGGMVWSTPLPPCAHLPLFTPPYWECYIRHITVTAYHFVGTCRMGSENDATAVVDHMLQVHKTSRLRVVDASVMPTMPSANINAAVMMIAEKAADLIKAHWHLQSLQVCHLQDVFLTRPTNCRHH